MIAPDSWWHAPFAANAAIKQPALLEQLVALQQFHRTHCAEYDRILTRTGACAKPQHLADLPYLPVQLFKRMRLSSVADADVFKTLRSSGTSGQTPSQIVIDRDTAQRQSRALSAVLQDFIGPARLPMVVIDQSPSLLRGNRALTARSAATLGFTMSGRDHLYLLDDEMRCDFAALRAYLDRHAGGTVLYFGMTAVVWQCLLESARAQAIRLPAHASVLIHGGGWKKMSQAGVDRATFRAALSEQLGIERIHDYYGMVEQVGSIYMENADGHFVCPSFSDVIIRDRNTLEPLPPGREGLIQVVSLVPHSYPGQSLLTEDLGVLQGEDSSPCGRMGKVFTVSGRLPQAELRGCSDTFDAV